MAEQTREPSTLKSGVTISHKALSISSLVVGLVCLVTLVVVVYLKDIDTLSTVALALAILAFVVQLMVYIIQTSQATEQGRQANELHGRTMSILAQIEERTQGTQRSMESTNARIIEALIGKASSQGLDLTNPETAAAVAESASEATTPNSLSQQVGVYDWADNVLTNLLRNADWPPPLSDWDKQKIRRQLRAPLRADEVDEVEKLLLSFTLEERGVIAQLTDDLWRTSAPDSPIGPGLSIEGPYLLQSYRDLGYIAKVPGWTLYTLTPAAYPIARAFHAGTEERHAKLEALVQETLERNKKMGGPLGPKGQ